MAAWLPGTHGLILVREQIGQCDICGVPFFSDRDLRAHFATVEHREAVQAALDEREAHKKRLAIVYESPDPEVEAHMKKVGETMKREGRWVVKPNEKAGFS